MINLVVSKIFKDLKATLDEYGMMSDIKFSSDVETISEYTKSFRIRSLMADYKLLTDAEMTSLNTNPNYVVGLYNRSSLKIIDGLANNINIDAVTVDNNIDLSISIGDLTDKIITYDPIGYEVRQAIAGSIDIKCKLLTANSNTLEMLEYIIMGKYIKQNPKITILVNAGEGVEPHEFEYNTTYSEIDEYGLIDTKNYGDLQQISFNVNVYGIFLSMFKHREKSMYELQIESKLMFPDENEKLKQH